MSTAQPQPPEPRKAAAPEVAAFVMARGGSKSVPGKNIRPLAGVPMIGYSFKAARESRYVRRTFLSTDSPQIADVGRQWGAEVPFMRPAELARDDSPGFAALLHAVRWVIERLSYKPDIVVELLPTSPLRTAADIDRAVELLLKQNADSVVSVVPASQHPYWMKTVDAQGRLTPFMDTPLATRRRQDLPPVYALHGAIKMARCDVLLEKETWYTPRTHAYLMPQERSLDVDTPWDFHLAELVLCDQATTAGACPPPPRGPDPT
jgi:CMP-N,N'-diacetyllegionaminic acid synthase